MPELRFLDLVRDGFFEIDADGRIWRIAERWRGRVKAVPRRRAEHCGGRGYLQVRMMDGGVRLGACAHRVVFAWFKGPIPAGYEVNHINGRKDDNRPENLEAVTASDNMKHAHRTGLKDQRGEANPGATLTDADVVAIRVLYLAGEHTVEELGALFGVAFQHVARLVKGERRRTAGGPVASGDLRYIASDRDPITGRFLPTPAEVTR